MDEMNWDTHIRSYLSSGLSVARYCQRAGIKAYQFKYRYNKHRQQQASKKSAASICGFIPVNVKEAPPQKSNAVEIHFPNGCRCLVSFPFNEGALAQIIRILRS